MIKIVNKFVLLKCKIHTNHNCEVSELSFIPIKIGNSIYASRLENYDKTERKSRSRLQSAPENIYRHFVLLCYYGSAIFN